MQKSIIIKSTEEIEKYFIEEHLSESQKIIKLLKSGSTLQVEAVYHNKVIRNLPEYLKDPLLYSDVFPKIIVN